MPRTDKARTTIQRLRALIDHPRTGEAERAAARRMLGRVLEKFPETTATGWVDRREYGDKYAQTRHLPLAGLTKLMRADIAFARKLGRQAATRGALALMDALGTMPAEIRVSVRCEHYSGGGAIHIRVKDIPREWGFAWGRDRWGQARWLPTPALSAVLTDLAAIHWAYNYDGSDAYTDHYDKNYGGQVHYDRPYDEGV